MRKIDMENLSEVDFAKILENVSEENLNNIYDEQDNIDNTVNVPSIDELEDAENTDNTENKEIHKNSKDKEEILSHISDTLENIEENEEDESLYDSNTIKVVLQDYKELKEKYDELNDKYVRTMADFGNFRKRNLEENKAKIEKSKVGLLKEIITLNDTFERAFKEADENQSFENLYEGVKAIKKMVDYTLEKENIRQIESVGEKFNPEMHDCILVVPAPGTEAETIIEEIEKGYMLGKTVIRPSKVVVSGGSPEVSDSQNETEETQEESIPDTEAETVSENTDEEVEIPVNVIEE